VQAPYGPCDSQDLLVEAAIYSLRWDRHQLVEGFDKQVIAQTLHNDAGAYPPGDLVYQATRDSSPERCTARSKKFAHPELQRAMDPIQRLPGFDLKPSHH